MRIIAGKFRRRQLRQLRGMKLRPTSDRLRETLFDVIGAAREIKNSVWLDLFAGSGAVGIEALSRGAQQVYFVESSKQSATLIRQNLADMKVQSGYQIVESDAPAAIRQLSSSTHFLQFDFCFLDPPYLMEDIYAKALLALADSRLLKPAGLVIAEHSKHFDPGERFNALERYRKLAQGDAVLSFYNIE